MVERNEGKLRSPMSKTVWSNWKYKREWGSWYGMNRRCYFGDQGDRHWHRYGGRGIEVCERWRYSNPQGFRNFISDMGIRPESHSLDRINGDGHYEPSNCQWSTMDQQRANQKPQPCGEAHPKSKVTESDVREIRSSSLSQRAIAKLFGISQSNVRLIKNYGSWKHV
jgi:hypothetical protein